MIPGRQTWPDRREELLHRLDVAERGVGRFYVGLLCLLMAAATGLAVFLYFRVPDDGNRDFVLLYAGAAYVMGMAWAAAQLSSALRRLSPPPDLLSGLRSRINVTLQSAPQVQFVDEQALDRAKRHLDAGGDLDGACAAMDARYREMNPTVQTLFRNAVEVALRERGKR